MEQIYINMNILKGNTESERKRKAPSQFSKHDVGREVFRVPAKTEYITGSVLISGRGNHFHKKDQRSLDS